MRMIASFYKHDEVRFVSHLDMQRLFQRAFRRARLPLVYSNGFNPHPLLSFATALSVGYTSDGEYLDVQLSESIEPDEFAARMNAVLPEGVGIVDASDAGGFKTSLTQLMRSAEYDVHLKFASDVPAEAVENAISELASGEINVMKRTKGGMKQVDIAPLLISVNVERCECDSVKLKIIGKLTSEGGLPLELFLSALCEKLGIDAIKNVNRRRINMDWAVIG